MVISGRSVAQNGETLFLWWKKGRVCRESNLVIRGERNASLNAAQFKEEKREQLGAQNAHLQKDARFFRPVQLFY